MPYGMNYLKDKLKKKQPKIEERYMFYNMKVSVDSSSSLNKELRGLIHKSGWCAKAVDGIADRICFRGFENDRFNMNEIFRMNNQDVFVDNVILGALISSCDFVYISKDEENKPKLQAIEGSNATGIIDPTTNLLIEGYAILGKDKDGNTTREAYFTPEKTYYYVMGKKGKMIVDDIIENPAPYPLLVPIINRPDANHPFGRSRINDACMEYQKGMLRTLHRSEISAEYYSFPQKYILGTDPDAEALNKFKASVSTMLEISKDEDGDKPVVGQFTQQSMSPYVDQIKMYASLFAGETGLTTDDLGFKTENPSGAESIKASHENLRLYARKSQKNFKTGLLNVGYLAACVRDNTAYKRYEIYDTEVKFEPIFEPDMSALSLIGDGAIKLNSAVPGFINKENLRDLTGIESKTKETDPFEGVDLTLEGDE